MFKQIKKELKRLENIKADDFSRAKVKLIVEYGYTQKLSELCFDLFWYQIRSTCTPERPKGSAPTITTLYQSAETLISHVEIEGQHYDVCKLLRYFVFVEEAKK